MINEPKIKTVGDLKKVLNKIPDTVPILSCSSTGRWDGCDRGFEYIENEVLCFMGIDDMCFNNDLKIRGAKPLEEYLTDD